MDAQSQEYRTPIFKKLGYGDFCYFLIRQIRWGIGYLPKDIKDSSSVFGKIGENPLCKQENLLSGQKVLILARIRRFYARKCGEMVKIS